MPQLTLTEAFGVNATKTGTQLTIDFNDLETATGLNDASTASPSQLVATLLRYWNLQTSWTSDPDKGIAPGLTQTKQVVTVRGTTSVSQISRPITINCYETDNQSTFDPDNII